MTNYYPQIQHSRFLADADRAVLTVADDANLTAFVKGKIILAIMIGYNGKDTLASAYKLQWRDVTDGGSFTGGGTNGGDVGATGEVKYSASSAAMADGDAIAKAGMKCTNMDSSMTWQDGLCNVGDNLLPDAGTLDLASDCYSELHWALDLTDAQAGHQYEFRLWNNTSGATAGTCAAKVTTQSVTTLTVADLTQAQTAENVILPPPGVMDYYLESNRDNYHGLGTNNPYAHVGIGQSFTGDGKYASGAKFSLCKYGLPTGTAYFRIRAYSGTWANQDGVPTGGVLAEGTLDVATLDDYANFALKEVAFATPYQTEAGTHYVVTIEYTGTFADANNYVCVGLDATSATHAGNESSLVGTTWGAESSDMDVIFYVMSSSNIGLVVSDLAQAQTVETFALVQKFTLTSQDAAQAQAIDSFAIVQKFTLAGLGDLTQAQALDAGLALSQSTLLAAAALAQAQQVEDFSILQKFTAVPADLAQGQTADNISLAMATIDLSLEDLGQNQALEAGLQLIEIFTVALADLAQGQALNAPALTQIFLITSADLGQLQVIDAPALVQKFTIALDDLAQSQGLDALAVVQRFTLAIQDALQAQTLEEVALQAIGSLGIQDASQGQQLAEVILSQLHNLINQDASQGQQLDAVELNVSNNILADDLAQIQGADAVELTQQHNLIAQDSSQGQALDQLLLTQRHNLLVAELTQVQGVDPLIIEMIYQMQGADLAQDQTVENTTLAQLHNLIILAAIQNQAIEAPTLNQGIILATDNLLSTQYCMECPLGYLPDEERLLTQDAENRLLCRREESRILTIPSNMPLPVVSESRVLKVLPETRLK